MFETETVGPCLVQKMKWAGEGGEAMAPWPPIPVATLFKISKRVNFQVCLSPS